MNVIEAALATASIFVLVVCSATSAQTSKSQLVRLAPSSGRAMCAALAPSDFTRLGIAVTRLREANLESDSNAYCMYDNPTGTVEFDVFNPAGQSVTEANIGVRAAMASIAGTFALVLVPGADEAQSNATHPYKGTASIVVRRGLVVFDINIPAGPRAGQQLLALSQLVLSRLRL